MHQDPMKLVQFPLYHNWLVLSDEQMSKTWPFSRLNDAEMSNCVGVKHLPDKIRLFNQKKHCSFSSTMMFPG